MGEGASTVLARRAWPAALVDRLVGGPPLFPKHLRRWLLGLTIVTVACLGGLGLILRGSHRPLLFDAAIDRSLLRTSGMVHRLALLLSDVGHPGLFVTITVAVALALLLVGDYRAALTSVVTVPLTLLLVEDVLKPFFDRHLGSLPLATFPSGHTAVAAALGGAIILAAGGQRPLGRRLRPAWRYGLVATVLLLCAAIGLAMVVLRLHYLTDVVAALPLGLTVTGGVALGLDVAAARWQRAPGDGPRRDGGSIPSTIS
jgi:membrane-associated phospholipid phosphatase